MKFALALLFGVGAVAGQPGARPAVPADNVLRVVLSAAPASLDPQVGLSSQDRWMSECLFATLFQRLPAGSAPVLVDHYSHDANTNTYRFTLKTGLTWSDGRPLTAHDVVFTARRSAELIRRRGVQSRHVFSSIEGFDAAAAGRQPVTTIAVVATSATEFSVRSRASEARLTQDLSDFTSSILPEHAIRRHGTAWTESAHLVSSGPFVLGRADVANSIALRKNPRFALAREVALDGITFYFGGQERSSMRLAQEFDAHVVLRADAEAIEMAMRLYPDRVRVSPGTNVERMSFNMASPVFADVRARMAVSWVLDVPAAIRRASLIASPAMALLPGASGHLPEDFALGLEERRRRAAAHLAALGYSASRPMKVALGSYEVRNKRQYVRYLLDDLAHAGITVDARFFGSYQELAQAFAKGDIDATITAWGGFPGDPAYFLLPVYSGGFSLLNMNRPDLDQRITETLASSVPARRESQATGILREVARNYYAIPLLTQDDVGIFSPRVAAADDGLRRGIWRLRLTPP